MYVHHVAYRGGARGDRIDLTAARAWPFLEKRGRRPMARHVFFGLLASLGLLFGARDALAQRAPELTGADEVILKNGGMLRGTVVAIEPEKSVTIFVMLTGEQR